MLLVCGDKDRATVVDVTGTPRIERTFDVPATSKRDRFTGSDDGGLGFLGPCDPRRPRPASPRCPTTTPPRPAAARSSAPAPRATRGSSTASSPTTPPIS